MKLQQQAKQLSIASLLATLASAQLYPVPVSNISTTACPHQGGVHIIAARGSTIKPEPGYGAIGYLKDDILRVIPGSTAEFVHYPATLGDYVNSESDGVLAMRKSINDYISRCNASSPLVLMGYSQGAQVTGDALVGQDDGAFPMNASISEALPINALSRVAAVILMGDPSFNTSETFHVGNATKNGIFPRRNVASFDMAGLSSKTRSYCDFNDPFCASGNRTTGLQLHLGYIQEYGSVALEFVESQVKAFYNSNATSTPVAYTGAASRQGCGQFGAVLTALFVGFLVWLL